MRVRGSRIAYREINDKTPRRALIFGSAMWLAKQMNLIKFTVGADQLFYEREIELWVVGNIPDHLTKNHFLATRVLGFVADLEPIFRGVGIGIVAERTGGGFKLKVLDYIFNRVPIAAIKGSIAGLPLTPETDYLWIDAGARRRGRRGDRQHRTTQFLTTGRLRKMRQGF